MIHSLSKDQIPEKLRHLPTPPQRLFVCGEVERLAETSVAIVGTRKPTAVGLRAAFYFAKELSAAGFCIVSGLARGIDGAAHRGALKASGRTVAVIGHGFSRPIYPLEHTQLSRDILRLGGAIVSEFDERVPPLPHHFPQRNRIIAGLSLAVIVIEATEKSGSLITALQALDAGREVFVLPGSFDSSNYSGSHSLIRQGATLVGCPQEVIEELGGAVQFHRRSNDAIGNLFEECQESLSFEELWERSTLTVSKLSIEVESRLESGELFEISPRRYVWTSDRSQRCERKQSEEIPRSVSTFSCQTGDGL